jgi:starch phosphorylase
MERYPGHDDLARRAEALASRVPDSLAVLARIALNFRWCWSSDGPALYRWIDAHRWGLCLQNPVRLLQQASVQALERASRNAELLDRAAALESAINAELARPHVEVGDLDSARPAVFFCAEFGLHRALPIYAGGLGALAGDVLKQASDQAMPLIGVGLMYRRGYFRQRLDESGWQHEYWIDTDPERLPTALVTGPDGAPLTIKLSIRNRNVTAQIWRVDVGCVPLYLLDTERPENSRLDRWISGQLYVADRSTRLAQYLLLGVGGIRALRALGIEPGLIHLNEGHAALAPLELARAEVAAGHDVRDALESARARTVFTTHTPVAAGNDTYDPREIDEVLDGFIPQLGLPREAFMALGRSRPDDAREPFGVTQLGLRMSRSANGVSRRHGEVARGMWRALYPGKKVADVPIGYVTNGVHVPTWMAPAMRALLDLHLGRGWEARAADPATWARIDSIPDEELWAVRNRLRTDLVDYVRDRSVADRLERDEPLDYVEAAARAFSPDVITIGFARRLATYKRLYLLVHDTERSVRLLSGPEPLQLLIAGKAHPADDQAKRLLQTLFSAKSMGRVGERVAVLHDYDLGMAMQLTRGCDVWLNAPRPPLEASGTSGMKSVMNGGLQVSVLDGWWAEAYDGSNGWAVSGEVDPDTEAQDARHAAALYEILEREVLPQFYQRDQRGIPRRWLARVKASLKTLGPRFSAARMIEEYAADVYTKKPG